MDYDRLFRVVHIPKHPFAVSVESAGGDDTWDVCARGLPTFPPGLSDLRVRVRAGHVRQRNFQLALKGEQSINSGDVDDQRLRSQLNTSHVAAPPMPRLCTFSYLWQSSLSILDSVCDMRAVRGDVSAHRVVLPATSRQNQGGTMDATGMAALFQDLTTAHVADACVRARAEVRCAPCDLRALCPSYRLVGRVRPARHYGSVDIFLEALENASPGEVLVIDNSGRRDEACVRDLIALESKLAGLSVMIIWGLHRDTQELLEIGLPMFTLGECPTGPLRLDPREA